jgi:hypothetical protein
MVLIIGQNKLCAKFRILPEINMKKILLRNSWQVNNIGDIAHPLGFLNLAKQFLPECEIWLWPCIISPAVREIILRNFQGLNLVETEEALQKAFAECDLLINGSRAGMEAAGVLDWKERTGKPYGLFGVSADGLWTEKSFLTFAAELEVGQGRGR